MGSLVYIQNIKNLREIAFSHSSAHSVALAIFLIQSKMNGPLEPGMVQMTQARS